MATNQAARERPLAKELAAMLPKPIEGKMKRKLINAITETKTLTHHGHSASRLSALNET